jgi:DNA-binding transcriptional MerR regulator
VYGITVAAELAGMSVQALRLYERKGLLEPARTGGGSRRYSDADIARLRRIRTLIAEGINLTGIARVLGLEADNAGLRARNAHLRTANTALRRTGGPTGDPAEADDVPDSMVVRGG